MKRRDLTKAKLQVAKRELVIRRRQYATAQRGLAKVLRTIGTLEQQLEKYDLAGTQQPARNKD